MENKSDPKPATHVVGTDAKIRDAVEAVWRCSLVIESSVRRGDGPDQYAQVKEALGLVKQARATLQGMPNEPSEIEKLRSALAAAVETIQDYLAYTHDGDPWKEDSRAMGEMDINDYGKDGRLEYALTLMHPAPAPREDANGN